MAAGEASVIPGLVTAASHAVTFAWQHFGDDPTGDVVDLRRVQIAIAYRVGSFIAPGAFPSPPLMPVSAYGSYLREPDSEMTVPERDAVILLWQLCAALDQDVLAFEQARALPCDRGNFAEESQLFGLLLTLFSEPEHLAWARYRSILLKWSGAVASADCEVGFLHRPLKFALSLGYSQYHLKRTDRDTFMSVILAQV